MVIGTSIYYPRAFSQALREHLDLVFVDSRHFVPSYAPTDADLDALTLETLADDVEALRLALGIERWVVIGHSIQAQIALAYARQYSSVTDRLALIAGVPYAGEDVGKALQDLWNSQASERRKSQHNENIEGLEGKLRTTPAGRQFAVNYIANAALYWADPTYDSGPLWEGVMTSPVLAQLVRSLPGRSDVKRALDSLDLPTLVVVGKHDYAVPYTIWESLIADAPHVTYVLMDQDSHNPQTESPDRFDPIFLNWLAR